MGWLFRKTAPAKDLAREGIRCRATVEHSEMVGGGIEANLSQHRAEDLFVR